jgi:anti-sigma-K factor RskA
MDRNEEEEFERLIAALSQGNVPSASTGAAGEAERLAASYAIGRLPRLEPMPRALERRLLQSAHRTAAASRPIRPSVFAALIGRWGLPALCASIAVISFLVARLLPSDLGIFPRVMLSQSAATYAWAPGPDAAGANAHGYVAWVPSQNSGYIVFDGLKPNDPRHEQYQLWILDSRRDARYPVDGGVFDVPAGGQEVRVKVNPRLHVGQPAAFVVTMERAGGVVVSDRGRVVAIAKVAGS